MDKPAYSLQVVTPNVFAGTAADEIIAELSDLFAEFPDRKINVVLAGGGTPISVYKALSVTPRSTAIDWKRINFFYGDERYVKKDDPQNNYKMSYDTFLNPLRISNTQVFPVNTNLSSAKAAAADYNEVLNKKLSNKTFDLVMLGMGEDGHTASIFPGSELLEAVNNDLLASNVIHPVSSQPRISITVQAIHSAKKIIVFVTGLAKKEVLEHVLHAKKPHYPIQVLEKVASNVTFVVDTQAYTDN